MTIVLQNQYWDLDVKKNSFSVTLSFNKKKETLEIPFRSITKFYDPFVKFSIQLELKSEKNIENKKKKKKKKKNQEEKIITLDDFRKKMSNFRIEKDTLGKVKVPKEKFWGAQTQRSLENFNIGNDKMPKELIYSFAIQKSSCNQQHCIRKFKFKIRKANY